MGMDVDLAVALIKKAREQERDERLYRQWVAQLPVMAMQGVSVSFAEYRDRMTGANIDTRPASVILAELDEIEKQFDKKGGAEDGTSDFQACWQHLCGQRRRR